MAELKIYDSQGERVGSDNHEYSERIENFFFGGVRLYIETQTRSQAELVVFFRARESEASRAEQYYAVYRTDTLQNIFDKFTAELRNRIENEHGMLLQTTSEDVEVFNALAHDQATPGTLTDHDNISPLLSERKQVEIGVSSNTAAVGLLQKYLNNPCKSIAISDDISITELGKCDMLIELGSDEEFEPLGETKDQFAEKSRQTTISSSELQDLSEDNSQEDNYLNKVVQITREVGVFIAIFLLLFVLLVIVASVTSIDAISAFDIGNLVSILTNA